MKIPAKKSLGQNFLSNPRILEKICAAAQLTKGDTVLEVGPGTGNLTQVLSEKAQSVIAIEKDHRLIEELAKRFPDTQRIKVIEGDVLEINPESLDLKAREYKIVANIPYYITSHFIRTVFEQWPRPSIIVLTIQKEVAQRIVAQPPHMNLLALSVQFYADTKIIDTIKRGSFNPVPKVDSVIIKIVPRIIPPLIKPELFFRIIKAGFSSPRKQLINNLPAPKETVTTILQNMRIDPKTRPEALNLEQWVSLAAEIFQN